MEYNDNLLYFDFQGWPVYKRDLRYLLKGMKASTYTTEDGKQVVGFDADDPVLDTIPVVMEEDGMGYGINEGFFNEVDTNAGHIRFWKVEECPALLKRQVIHNLHSFEEYAENENLKALAEEHIEEIKKFMESKGIVEDTGDGQAGN